MINIIKEGESFYLSLGYDFVKKEPLRKLLLTHEEVSEIANTFTEEFAVHVGLGEETWSFNEIKLTNAPLHPFGWTDNRERTILHYKDSSWHMIPTEIAEIGKLAKRAL